MAGIPTRLAGSVTVVVVGDLMWYSSTVPIECKLP